MKESRLFKILYYLLDNNQATAKELAKKFEVSIRTIYRDIDSLSEAGIPVYSTIGRNGGIKLMDGFILDKAILSKEEKQEILASLKGLSILDSFNTNDTLEKLSAIFNERSENWFEVDFSRWGDKEEDNEKFKLIKQAIIKRNEIKIYYANSYGEFDKRVIQPIKLLYKSKSWYIKAFCTKKQDFRVFKLNRILKLNVLNKTFAPLSFPKEDKTHQKYCLKKIKLLFPKTMAYRVYDEFDASEVKGDENGNLIVSIEIPEDYWIINFLLSFGGKVEIIEPIYLKKILAKKAKEIYEKNKI